jgi:hypothetical protein
VEGEVVAVVDEGVHMLELDTWSSCRDLAGVLWERVVWGYEHSHAQALAHAHEPTVY